MKIYTASRTKLKPNMAIQTPAILSVAATLINVIACTPVTPLPKTFPRRPRRR